MRFVPTILVAVTVIPLVATAVAETQPAAATTHPHIAPDPRGGWITDKEAILVPIPGQKRLWRVTVYGEIFELTGPDLAGGSPPCANLSKNNCSRYKHGSSNDIVAAAATPSGTGLWAVDKAGYVWTAGDAKSYGDVHQDKGLLIAPVGIAATPSGNGYIIACDNGGVFVRGDADPKYNFGSTGGKQPGAPVTGFAVSRDASGAIDGYWLINRAGHILLFGAAPNLGEDDSQTFITDLAASSDGRSYAWVDQNAKPTPKSPPADVTITANSLTWTAPPSKGVVSLETPDPKSNYQHWQLWNVAHAGDAVQLFNRATGLCFTVNVENQVNALQDSCKSEGDQRDGQLFSVDSGGGYAIIRWAGHGETSVQPGSDGLKLVSGSAYLWSVALVGPNLTITSAVSGRTLAAEHDNQQLLTVSADSSEEPRWILRPATGNAMQIVNARTRECVQVPGNNVRAPLDTASCYSSPAANSNQSWQVWPGGKGARFVPAAFPDYGLAFNAGSQVVELVKRDPEHDDPGALWTVSDQNHANPVQPDGN